MFLRSSWINILSGSSQLILVCKWLEYSLSIDLRCQILFSLFSSKIWTGCRNHLLFLSCSAVFLIKCFSGKNILWKENHEWYNASRSWDYGHFALTFFVILNTNVNSAILTVQKRRALGVRLKPGKGKNKSLFFSWNVESISKLFGMNAALNCPLFSSTKLFISFGFYCTSMGVYCR